MSKQEMNELFVRPFTSKHPLGLLDQSFHMWKQKNFKSLEIEVGCGVGFHPIDWAKNHQESGMIAIERTKTKFGSLQKRMEGHPQLENIYPVHGDALDWLPFNIQDEEIDKYYFLYPNPYPKEAQANKRWHRNPLMHKILASLKPSGQIHFATNEAWLAEEYKTYMVNYWQLSLVEEKQIEDEKVHAISHFEKKYLKRGDTCYHIICQKPASD